VHGSQTELKLAMVENELRMVRRFKGVIMSKQERDLHTRSDIHVSGKDDDSPHNEVGGSSRESGQSTDEGQSHKSQKLVDDDMQREITRDLSGMTLESRSDPVNEYSTDDDDDDDDGWSTISSEFVGNRVAGDHPDMTTQGFEEIGDHTFEAFQATYEAKFRSKMAESGTTQGRRSSEQSTESSVNAQSGESSREGAKMVRSGNYNEASEDKDTDDGQKKDSRLLPPSGEKHQRYLACPFYKKDPIKYKDCQMRRLDRVSRVK
jgi:hypothetical protein